MPRPDRSTKSDRAAKVAQIEKAGKAAERRRGTMIWGALAAVVAIIIGLVAWAIVADSPALADLSDVEVYDYPASVHPSEAVEYTENPPVGGPHNQAWWNCGVYQEEIPKEHAVHSLEHGAVWLTYQPSLPADQIAALERLGQDSYMLVSPNSTQDNLIVASSWNHQLSMDELDERLVRAFIREYKEGPATPEPGGLCSNGTVVDLVNRS